MAKSGSDPSGLGTTEPTEEDRLLPPGDVAGTASFAECLLNLLKATLGTGFLVMPFAFRSAGGGLATGLTAACAAAVLLSFHLLSTAQALSGAATYHGIGQRIDGAGLGGAVTALQALYAFGSCISYLMLIASSVTSLAPAGLLEGPTGKFVAMALPAAGLLLPLSLSPTLRGLAVTSLLGTLCNVYTFALLVYTAAEQPGPAAIADPRPVKWEGAPLALPIIAFAFNCHIQYLPIIAELSRPSRSRITALCLANVAILCAFFISFARVGLYAFGDRLSPDGVLADFEERSPAVLVARGAILFGVAFSYPLYAQPTCRALHEALRGGLPAALHWRGLVVLWVLATFVGAMALPSLAVCLQYTGAVTGSALMYVLPGLFCWCLLPSGGLRLSAAALAFGGAAVALWSVCDF